MSQTNAGYSKTINSKQRMKPVEGFKQPQAWQRTDNKRKEPVEASKGFYKN